MLKVSPRSAFKKPSTATGNDEEKDGHDGQEN